MRTSAAAAPEARTASAATRVGNAGRTFSVTSIGTSLASDDSNLRAIANALPGWRWCRAPLRRPLERSAERARAAVRGAEHDADGVRAVVTGQKWEAGFVARLGATPESGQGGGDVEPCRPREGRAVAAVAVDPDLHDLARRPGRLTPAVHLQLAVDDLPFGGGVD